MSPYWIVFLVLLVILLDIVVSLFKQVSTGNLAIRLKDLESETKSAAFACALCCFPLSFVFTVFAWKCSPVLEAVIYPVIFLSVAYAFYRPIILCLDKAARKHACHPLVEKRVTRARKTRRWSSLVLAALALLASYFTSPLIYKLLPSLCQ